MILCSYVVQCTPACSDTSCVKKKCALQSGFRSFICLGDPLPRDRLGPKELACPGAVGDNVEQRVCRGSKAPSSARARPPLNAGRVRATLPAAGHQSIRPTSAAPDRRAVLHLPAGLASAAPANSSGQAPGELSPRARRWRPGWHSRPGSGSHVSSAASWPVRRSAHRHVGPAAEAEQLLHPGLAESPRRPRRAEARGPSQVPGASI